MCFFKKTSEILLQFPEFEIWVCPQDQGIGASLAQRAKKIKKGIDPGPEREPDFNWILRTEIEQLAHLFKSRTDRLVIYDLGANLGLNSLIMASILKKNLNPEKYLIYAIEPNPDNAKLLRKNLAHNQIPAKIIECAISDYIGQGEFHTSQHSNLGALIAHSKTDGRVVPVKVLTLSAFAREFNTGQMNFLKMDLEGGEVEVLKGAREYLRDCDPPAKILMEVHPFFYNEKRSLAQEIEFLLKHNWTGKYMVSAGVAQPDKFRDAGLKPFIEFKTRSFHRGIYRDFSSEQLLEFACYEHLQEVPGKKPSKKIVRAVLLEKK